MAVRYLCLIWAMANVKNPDRVNKDKLIRVRVTQEEHDRFMKQATENGYKSLSDYIRTLISDVNKGDNDSVKE